MCLYCWVTLINTVLKRLFSVNLFFTGIKISSVPFLMDISSSFYPASVIIKFWTSDTLRALWTIATLFNPKLDVRIENVISDKEGRYILLEVSLYDSTFLLCNIYSPNDNNSQKIFFSKLNDTLREYTDMQIVLGGDFNCALAPIDKTGGTSIERKKDSN